jgi:fructosamine-3-kinase
VQRGELYQQHIDARLLPLVAPLVTVRRMDVQLPEQLIHGGLNAENILVAPEVAPAIIDMTPYWRPTPLPWRL